MASIQKHGKGWRVQLQRNGRRLSKVFPTKAAAAAWATQAEGELTHAILPDRTVADAAGRYAKEVSPQHRGHRWEALRLAALAGSSFGKRKLSGLSKADISDWRDARLGQVAPASVAREMTLMRSVFEACRRDWGWLRANPMQDVRKPRSPPSRKRRVTADEIARLVLACGGEGVDTATQRIGMAFLFALETAMRSGEVCGLHWPDIDLAQRVAVLPRTKNGDRREVPLSTRAVEIVEAMPQADGPVFGLTDAQRDALFRKARDRAGLVDLHFHDSRAEAIWRLSKKLDVLQLARVIGHRDPKSLMLYYNETGAELAKRLD